jgi:CheY-like chemotaxis protein
VSPILVVDDDRDIRECIAEVLEDEGFRVEQAENGCEAIAKLDRTRPSLVVLDLMMPVMSGWEFLDHKRQRSDVADVPVIVATASFSENVAAERVLRKPFEIDELVRAVRELTVH